MRAPPSIPDSSMAEQPIVNRQVLGSNPSWGAWEFLRDVPRTSLIKILTITPRTPLGRTASAASVLATITSMIPRVFLIRIGSYAMTVQLGITTSLVMADLFCRECEEKKEHDVCQLEQRTEL